MNFKPYNLKVNYTAYPYAITDIPFPVFSWAVDSEGENLFQQEYKITVSHMGKELWDSGFVKSDEQIALYTGEMLPSGAKIDYSITVRDNTGKTSKPSFSHFTTACFEKMQGKWIASPLENDNNVQCFFKKFVIEKEVVRAVLYHCGIGLGRARINGVRLNENRLNPAFTNYVKECLYITDVIDPALIKKGENTVEIDVAGGWRKNYGRYLDNMSTDRQIEFMGNMCLNAQLVIYFTDGTKEVIATDIDWECTTIPIVSAHLFNGETYDETYEKTYAKAVLSDFKTENFHAQTLEPIVVKQVVEPRASYVINGKRIYDFGENLAGVVRLKAKGTANGTACFKLRHAELVDQNGDIYTMPLRSAQATDRYIAKSGECDIDYIPEFTYHGFRYARLEIEGDFDGEVSLTAIKLYTDVDTDGFFRCGNSIVNEIYEAAIRTERCNIHSLATDCPQRDERLGWLNDATVRFPVMPYSFNIAQLFKKIAADITNEQDEMGRITCTAPYVFGERPADPVCSSYLIAAQEHYKMTGSAQVIEKHYTNFVMWNNYLKSRRNDGIVDYSYYGDWAGPEDCCNSGCYLGDAQFDVPDEFDPGATGSKFIPGKMISTGCHFLNYKILARFARILGKTEDEQEFRKEAECVQKSYLKKWFDKSTGKVLNGSQACQAFSLYIGIIPGEFTDKAAKVMADAVKESGMRIQTANITTPMLLDMLSKYSYEDIAWKLITSTKYPSLGYMIANGATTIWERFELKEDSGMNSHNHPMYASITGWIWRSLVGFKTVVPNKLYEINLNVPKELLYFETKIPLLCGSIYIRYEEKYGRKNLFTDVPFGMKLKVNFEGNTHEQSSGFHTV